MNNNLFSYVNKKLTQCYKTIFPVKSHSSAQSITFLLRNEIGATRKLCKQSTHKNHVTAVNTFERFMQQTDTPITADSLTADHIKAFERWALDQGQSSSYVALHMRCLRSLINRINGRGHELFMHIHTGNCQTEKRAVSEETIKQIRELKLPDNSNLALARDIFLFCFYGMGIPLVDAVMLKKSQLHEGHLIYNRCKTNRMVKIPVCTELQQLLDRLSPKNSPYLLPVITDNGADTVRQYRRFYQRYMRSLSKISNLLETNCHLTSYTPRHSWASIAYKQGININEIAQALGHANANITYHYVMELTCSQLECANNKVIQAVFG